MHLEHGRSSLHFCLIRLQARHADETLGSLLNWQCRILLLLSPAFFLGFMPLPTL
jgi:hypothetical protein